MAGARTVRWTICVGALVALSACGDDHRDAASVSTTDAATTTLPATTAPPSTTSTPDTTTASTSSPSTTTTVTTPPTSLALPESDPVEQATMPIAPPLDARASEPVVELGVISIPKIGVEMTMYEGIRLPTLDLGPGHWPGSALPGSVGNVVVGGHRVSGHAVFRNVDDLEAGDEIVFEDDEGRHVYEVREVEVIEPHDVWIVEPTSTPTATLFACHPPGSTSQRIAVFADLVSG